MPYELPNFTTTGGLEEVALETANQINGFWAGMLFFIFIVIWAGGYFSQDRTKGTGNAAMWGAIASLITTSGAFILYLIDNLISIEYVLISFVVFVVFAFAFLFSSRD